MGAQTVVWDRDKTVRLEYAAVVLVQLRGWRDFPERHNMFEYTLSWRFWYTDNFARVVERVFEGYVRNPSLEVPEGTYEVKAYVLLQDGCRFLLEVNGVPVIDHTHSGPEAHYWVGPVRAYLAPVNDVKVTITQPTGYMSPGIGGLELRRV